MALAALAGETNAGTEVRATLRVCGARECETVKTTLARLPALSVEGPGSTPLPPPAAAFYVLRLSVEGAPRVQKGWYVPSSRITRWNPTPTTWTKLGPRAAAFMRQHLPEGPPHRAPRPVRVVVAHRTVLDRAPYAHIFDRFPKAPGPPPRARWITVRVTWPAGTPWQFEHSDVFALPSRRILARPGGWFFIPSAFAKVIARDAQR